MRFFKGNSVCKRVCVLLAICMLLTALCLPASGVTALGEESTPPAFVSDEYLQAQLEALRRELLEAIASASGTSVPEPDAQNSVYRDVTLSRGSVIVLREDAEVIFRGGNAVVLTVSERSGEGVTDLATGEECFSGTSLQFAHIYYKSAEGGRACLLVTGDKAAFTLKGTYDIS